MKILRNEELRKTRSFLVVRMAYTSDPNTKFYQQDFTGIINKADGSKTVLDHLFSTRLGKKITTGILDCWMIEKGFYISYVGNGFSFHLSSFFDFCILFI